MEKSQEKEGEQVFMMTQPNVKGSEIEAETRPLEQEIKEMEIQLKGIKGEVKSLLGIFNRGDLKNEGLVDLDTLMQCVQQIVKKETFDQNILSVVSDLSPIESEGQLKGINLRAIEFLKMLNEYKQQLMYKDKNYKEADKIHRKLKDVQKIEQERWKLNVRAGYSQQVVTLENQQKESFEALSKHWDSYILNQDSSSYQRIQAFKVKQTSDFLNYVQFLKKDNVKHKPSIHLNILRAQENKLLTMDNFKKASKVQDQADEFEKENNELREQKQEETYKRKIELFQYKQEKTFEILMEKVKNQRENILKKRQKQIELMIQQNTIINQDINNKQKKDAKNMDDMIKYIIQYYDRDISEPNETIRKFVRGRKIISIPNNTQGTFKTHLISEGTRASSKEKSQQLQLIQQLKQTTRSRQLSQNSKGFSYLYQNIGGRSNSIDQKKQRVFSHTKIQ